MVCVIFVSSRAVFGSPILSPFLLLSTAQFYRLVNTVPLLVARGVDHLTTRHAVTLSAYVLREYNAASAAVARVDDDLFFSRDIADDAGVAGHDGPDDDGHSRIVVGMGAGPGLPAFRVWREVEAGGLWAEGVGE